MTNALTIKFLTIFTMVAGLMTAGCITSYPTMSLTAVLLGVASAGFLLTFTYLVYVQTKNP